MVRVAYQGTPGAYSEAAAVEFFGTDAELVPCESFDKIFDALQAGDADSAALPIENSLAGTIHKNLDNLVAHEDVYIVGELDFRVRHCLMMRKDGSREAMSKVHSHPMALAQCERYLNSRNLMAVEKFDTAGSAKMLSEGALDSDDGAIASKRAAELYGLDLLEEGIEDEEENYTRFLILSLQQSPASVDDTAYKTSVAFTLDNHPGILCKALGVFSVLDLDMTKIESRHVRSLRSQVRNGADCESTPWSYIFYIDVAADFNDAKVQTAFQLLRQITYVRPHPRHAELTSWRNP